MSIVRTNNFQVGQAAVASNNFTMAVPASADGTMKIARGNAGATTADIMTVSADNGVRFGNLRENVVVINSNTQAVVGTTYVCTESLTLTLPATANTGDQIGISNRSGTTTIVVARNGLIIMGFAEDLTIDLDHASFTLVYTDPTRGWVLI